MGGYVIISTGDKKCIKNHSKGTTLEDISVEGTIMMKWISSYEPNLTG
jgi:hypothetical protein